MASGFAVPVGFREIMVGRMHEATLSLEVDEDRTTLSRRRRRTIRPYVFPRKLHRSRYKPHALQTIKSRGFPTGRQW